LVVKSIQQTYSLKSTSPMRFFVAFETPSCLDAHLGGVRSLSARSLHCTRSL
jgi:hypothetical protein